MICYFLQTNYDVCEEILLKAGDALRCPTAGASWMLLVVGLG